MKTSTPEQSATNTYTLNSQSGGGALITINNYNNSNLTVIIVHIKVTTISGFYVALVVVGAGVRQSQRQPKVARGQSAPYKLIIYVSYVCRVAWRKQLLAGKDKGKRVKSKERQEASIMDDPFVEPVLCSLNFYQFLHCRIRQ